MLRNRLAFLAALLLLGALAWLGITGGVRELPGASSLGQKFQAFTQLAYGILSLLAVATTFWLRQWASAARVAWIVAVTTAGGLAPVVWGESGLGVGLLAGVSTLAIALVIVRLLAFGARAFARG